jgi:hypothetical protein
MEELKWRNRIYIRDVITDDPDYEFTLLEHVTPHYFVGVLPNIV